MRMIRDDWQTWAMMLIAIIVYVILMSGCASAPEQPITAYRQSAAMISNIYARQAEIESLVLYDRGYLVGVGQGGLSK